MIRILQATCESRLFFYIYPTPIRTLSHLRPRDSEHTCGQRGDSSDGWATPFGPFKSLKAVKV